MANEPSSTSTTVVVEGEYQRKPTLFPECISEALLTCTVLARTARKTAEGLERTVEGVDLVASTMLRQQQQRLLIELAPE